MDEGELAGTEKARQAEGIPAVGLDAIGGTLGDEGRADDFTGDVAGTQVSAQGKAGWARLINITDL